LRHFSSSNLYTLTTISMHGCALQVRRNHVLKRLQARSVPAPGLAITTRPALVLEMIG